MTTARDTPPATERSNPPCCTTSIWPSPTIAKMAAKGKLPAKEPYVTLDGANKRQTTMSAAVEMTTVKNSLENEKETPCARGRLSTCSPATLIRRLSDRTRSTKDMQPVAAPLPRSAPGFEVHLLVFPR